MERLIRDEDRRQSFPRLNLEPFDAFEFAGVAGDQAGTETASMGGDEEIHRADERALSFQLSSDLTVMPGILAAEIDHQEEVEKNFERAGFVRTVGFFDARPQFGRHKAGNRGFFPGWQRIERCESTENMDAGPCVALLCGWIFY